MTDREFLFEYHFGGSDWGITICASDAMEAREKIRAVGMARYKGEVAVTIRASLTQMPERIVLLCVAAVVAGAAYFLALPAP